MAAVFWPSSEVAVVKRRLRAPHPPFREEILCCQPVMGFSVGELAQAPISDNTQCKTMYLLLCVGI